MTATVTLDTDVFRVQAGEDGRLLGLDLGDKTVGLALSDVTRIVASPFQTLKRGKFAGVLTELSQIVTVQEIRGLVLGLPRNLDGSAGPRVQATRAFARNVSQAIEIPILLWDERWSTLEAERLLISADTSRKRRAEVIDKMAAALILQGALDRLRAS